MKKYLFLVRQDVQDFKTVVSLDAFAKVNQEEQLKHMLNVPVEHSENKTALVGMELRARFNTDIHGPCMVITDSELTYDELDQVIQYKHQQGQLADWIKEAKL